MNLQLNFIQPAEIRSASVVIVKSLLKIAALVAPVMMLLFLGNAYISYAEQKSKLELVEGNWTRTEIRLNRAQELTQKLQARRAAEQEISGWAQSRIDWPAVLAALRRDVPPTVQLKVMQARQALEVAPEGHARRSLRVILNGRGAGPNAEGRVEQLRQGIGNQPPLNKLIREARVTGFSEDAEAGAGPDDRSFQIEVDFIPRKIHATAAE